ncbi:MAG: TonB-dependent receptor [Dysgonamonadaceae bacterium]|jgi:TonB-linked SusC/RagA family outer membrane protein|nr:TonB-dependent receptor [Dysgonamonadaceae bacterium]MDD3900457.1 TonB-dependent receptor [Dysgonamonadaceae bacterium]MDD4399839.1 TonB-dependent receptor [Dysgonamonadaceae bacterium]
MRYSTLLCIIIFLLFLTDTFAQNNNVVQKIEVSGIVTDEFNEPLIGANVIVKDMPSLGATTNIDGHYKIKIEPFNRLVFSYIGFESQEILVKTDSIINVVMKESKSNVLEEVVITGTGVQKKINLTGAVTAVDVDVLKSSPSSNVTNALAGNVAGVLARQTSGQPGHTTSEFWIRGISTFGASNSALVLVDGFERNLDEINVEDIESFQVLKDASETAIYGARGANGVVLVTTKHGKPGKINISGKLETIHNSLIKLPEYVNGYDYAVMLNEARITRNQEPVYAEDELTTLKYGLDPDILPNVNWQDVILKDYAMSYRANLNLDGGGANARYFVSISYVEDEGMYKTDNTLKEDYNTNANSRRYNYRMNADMDVTSTTSLHIGLSGMLKKVNDSGKGTSAIWNSLTGQNPVQMPVTYSNGYYPGFNVSDIRDNPWVAATQTGYRQNWYNDLQTNVTLEQNLSFITKGLRFIGKFGYDTNNSNWINKIKAPERWTAERQRDDNGEIVFKRVNEEQLMSQSSGGGGDRREFIEAELHYNRSVKYHNFGGTLKYNQDSKVQTYNLGSDLKNSIPYRHQGVAGRIMYDWNHRYYVNFNFGYTGSENFAINNQFGFFPAFSLAWNISEEPIIKEKMSWLEMLKIRYSWGEVGNDNVGTRFPYMYTIGENMAGYQWADFDFSRSFQGKTYTRVASNGITWEIAKKHNLGIDISILQNKFNITADYFHETRTGIFMSRTSLPMIVGLQPGDNPRANVGGVLSRGVDGNYTFKQKVGEVNFTLRGNATYSKNEILDRDEGFKQFPYQYEKGYRVNQARGLIAIGLFKDWEDIRNSPVQNAWGPVWPGDIKYQDVNGNGVIGNEDRVAIGATTRPNLIYGLGLSAQWKKVDFNIHFQGAGKSSFFLSGGIAHPFSREQWGNVLQDVVNNHWISRDISGDPKTENPNAIYPRLEYGNVNGNNRQQSSFWLRDGSYLRLKTLEFGYNVPKNFVNKFKVNRMRVFFIGTNLLTFSKFKLWDPEAASNDGGGYPLSKSLTLGFTINI